MKKPFFTIITVTYNAGDKLLETIESITSQSFTDYRILVKDGLSTDGSIEKLKAKYDVAPKGQDRPGAITLIESCDNGIYHAMNIAASYLEGMVTDARARDKDGSKEIKVLKAGESPSYVFFLNCGDTFRDKDVLKNVHDAIEGKLKAAGTTVPTIFYGDIFEVTTGQRVPSNPKIDDHACYRNLPSHQACFYDERLIYHNPFELKYKVRADYEQFLRCFYRDKAETVYIPMIIANYEGGGYSAIHKKVSEKERKEIIAIYLPAAQIRKYDFLRYATLAPVRTFLAENKVTAGAYNGIKNAVYRIRSSKKEK
ncbi:glycosyltransferase [Butyrivibrio sp. MC2021]|uniref:glycosyltransferase n=1 Tax=Butyrivibrio sp. MC2021 TaxID=1408306 RepID=UPI00047B828D|nr:glycosyltransferase [Butyrivibrio sp. MC2021]